MDDYKKQIHIISHTHWDREWYLNSRYTNEWLVPFFDSLFKMMEKEPEYRFVLDGQTSMIDDYLDQLKLQGKNTGEYEQKLKKYGRERRLILGPYYLQPDWQLLSEEALVRNLLIGMRTAAEYGEPMKVGWLLDNFGQISQAPQIHGGFGIYGLFVWRGVEMDPRDFNSEFLWESPDGTKLPCVYFVSSYRNGMRLAEYHSIMKERIRREAKKILPFAATPNVLLMNGYDQEMEPDDIIPYIRDGKMDFDGFKVRQSTPEEYMNAVIGCRPGLKTMKGALYSGRYISVFPGTLSCRMYLKLQNDICQRELERYAEPLQAVARCLGAEYRRDLFARAWKILLKNHAHDSICGVGIDDVHTDMEKRFRESYEISNGLFKEAAGILASNIDTVKYNDTLCCFIVINTLLVRRDGIVLIRDEFDTDIAFRDGEGNILPSQKDRSGCYKVYLKSIPALGHTAVYAFKNNGRGACGCAIGDKGPISDPVYVNEQKRCIENSFIKVEINGDGTLNVADKINGKVYFNAAAFEDGGDSGDEYNYSYPEKDLVVTSKGTGAEISFEETGPIRAVARVKTVMELPEGISADHKARSEKKRETPIVTRITVECGSPVIGFKTRVENTVKDHRLRVLFPTGIRTDFSYAETQFDVVKRKIVPDKFDNSSIPDTIQRIIIGARESEPITTFPQRSFGDLSDGKIGAAVINRGLPEYEVLKDHSVFALTLFRGVNWITRTDLKTRVGDAGPEICVPDAQCLRTMEFNYAFYPHGGDWEEGKIPLFADQFNTALAIVKTGVRKGSLSDNMEFARLEGGSGALKITAIKISEDGQGLIVRICNLSDHDENAKIKVLPNITGAYFTNLNEEVTGGIECCTTHDINLNIPAKKIITIKVETAIQNLITAACGTTAVYRNEDPEKEDDINRCEPAELITEEDIFREESRAAKLEKELEQWETRLVEIKNTQNRCRLELDVETVRRASLEARLSALLLRKKFIENYKDPAHAQREEIKEIEGSLREIGYQLNKARVSKRALEYIAD